MNLKSMLAESDEAPLIPDGQPLAAEQVTDADVVPPKPIGELWNMTEEELNSRASALVDAAIASVQESPMEYYTPTKQEAKGILNAVRAAVGVPFVGKGSEPLHREYITMQKGTSNKYHYFAVFQKGREFIAANASGRIGYNPKVTIIDSFPTLDSAVAACDRKSSHKQITRGYEPTKIY